MVTEIGRFLFSCKCRMSLAQFRRCTLWLILVAAALAYIGIGDFLVLIRHGKGVPLPYDEYRGSDRR